MTTRAAILFLAFTLACSLSAHARLGDSVAETIFRYGEPVASTGQPGALTSTKTFEKSGLTITCGYVKGVVEMESYTRGDRYFIPSEIEALLRTNGRHKNWTGNGGGGFGPGTYHRADGATAKVTGTEMVITSPTWLDALAKDLAAAEKAVQGAVNNAAGSSATVP